MSFVASVLPSLTTITSKSGVRRPATCTARITRLAIVPPSLYAGKKMLRPGGRGARESAIGDDKPYHGNSLRTRLRWWRTDQNLVEVGPFGPGDLPPTRRQPPRQDHRLDDHRPRQLRCALAPLDECDWNFRASKCGARCLPGELHEECIAIGSNRSEWQPLECLAAPAPVAAGAVADRHSGDRADVAVRERTQHASMDRPVLDPSSWDVARPDDELGALCCLEQPRDVRRVVREVCIHLADVSRICSQRDVHT